jgi:hypothetical protein
MAEACDKEVMGETRTMWLAVRPASNVHAALHSGEQFGVRLLLGGILALFDTIAVAAGQQRREGHDG